MAHNVQMNKKPQAKKSTVGLTVHAENLTKSIVQANYDRFISSESTLQTEKTADKLIK